MVSAANASGLLGSAFAWLGGGQESLWLSAASGLFGGQLTALPTLSLLNEVSVFSANLLGGFFIQAVIVLFYLAWLSAWWFRHQALTGEEPEGSTVTKTIEQLQPVGKVNLTSSSKQPFKEKIS